VIDLLRYTLTKESGSLFVSVILPVIWAKDEKQLNKSVRKVNLFINNYVNLSEVNLKQVKSVML
jgi:hypothetical protein